MAKKFEDYPTHMKIAAVVTLLFYVACFIYVAWTFGEHLYRQEWLEAAFQFSLILLGWYWRANRKNKKKVKILEEELRYIKAKTQKNETAAFMRGWQGGIEFQRTILIAWANRRMNQR